MDGWTEGGRTIYLDAVYWGVGCHCEEGGLEPGGTGGCSGTRKGIEGRMGGVTASGDGGWGGRRGAVDWQRQGWRVCRGGRVC